MATFSGFEETLANPNQDPSLSYSDNMELAREGIR